MKLWFLYVVQCSDDTLYTGITTDINRRIREHNFTQRGAKYTRSRRPVRLVYIRKVEDRSSALKAEHQFKKLTRQEKLREIRERGSDENY
tara:strand:- start:287 stop:556 length:270 start_codon:yes stop_codon:yes gene_type:complete